MTWSRLRSTAAKKISFRVAIAIASFGSPKRNCLVAMYCFQRCVGNVKGIEARYSDASWVRGAGETTRQPPGRRSYVPRRYGFAVGAAARVFWHGTPVGGDYMKIQSASLLAAGMLLAGVLVTTPGL